MTIKKHVLAPGEWIGNVAARHGFRHWSALWDHEANAELRARRGEASLLMAGDELAIPDPGATKGIAVPTGQRVVFQVRPSDHVRLRIDGVASFIEGFGVIAYEARVGEVRISGELTEEAQEIVVPVQPGDEEVEVNLLGRTYVYRLGDVGPASERSGAFERLRHLGFLVTAEGQPIDPRSELGDAHLRRALRAFQRAQGLSVTGELDAPTQAALVDRYGA